MIDPHQKPPKNVDPALHGESTFYDFPLNLDYEANTHRLQMDAVRERTFVLDVGCHSGLFGNVLKEKKGCRVVGLELDQEALKIARKRLDSALSVDLEIEGWSEQLREFGLFDHVIFGDVLEHTRDPWQILRETKRILAPNGTVIISLPNVANIRVRMKLAKGDFTYEDSGALDKTHLRFFTWNTAPKLLTDSGYQVLSATPAGYSLPMKVLKLKPNLLAAQMVLVGKAV